MVPVIGNEVLLIGAALLWNWVERERQKRNLQDHRGLWSHLLRIVHPSPFVRTCSLGRSYADVLARMGMEATCCLDGWIHRSSSCTERTRMVG